MNSDNISAPCFSLADFVLVSADQLPSAASGFPTGLKKQTASNKLSATAPGKASSDEVSLMNLVFRPLHPQN